MSTEYRISYADLSGIFKNLNVINSNISTINSNIGVVQSEVQQVNRKQDIFEEELAKLIEDFILFRKDYANKTNLQLAETRTGNLKQDLEIKFGYYKEIRRMAVGILQGVDIGLVSKDTLKFTTEEVMIKAPGYWLAPALVSVSSWISNNKETCEKALKESIRRDDYKTTLFFMLVMRRLSRNDSSLKWLERYFMHQNPQDLDREFIIILEAVTTGVFHPAARILMMKNVKNWLEQLTQGDTFFNQQKDEWAKFYNASKPLPQEDKYPYLKKFGKNWQALENSLQEAKTHELMGNYFKDIISTSYDFSNTLKEQLDQILSSLVTKFDDEELPMRKQVRLNELIIEKEGDKDAAQAVMDAEKKVFEEKVDFLQMLTNAAFNPEASGATKVTQSLAISISQPWIIESYDTFVAQSRKDTPQNVELMIDGLNSESKDGSDENEQVSKQEKYYQGILKDELGKVKYSIGLTVLGGVFGVGGIFGAIFGITESPGWFVLAFLGLGIGGFIIWNAISSFKKKRKAITQSITERLKKAKEVLRGCIVEIVDYRKELSTEDGKAESTREIIASIAPEDFSSISKETSRNII